jgi:hypothetical protein
MRNPRLFIGSSSEALSIARTVKDRLKNVAEVVIWDEAEEFKPGRSILEALMDAKGRYDFAVMVFNADDELKSESGPKKITRDNVLFELGLFMGWLGRERTFFIYNDRDGIKIPSDLRGILAANYKSRTNNLTADIGEATFDIEKQIKDLGPLPIPDRATTEAGILNRIINAYIYPPYNSIESEFARFVNSQTPESISSMSELMAFSKDLILYYLHPLLKPRELRAKFLRVYFAYYLGDGVAFRNGACPRDCLDRNDVTQEELRGHFVVGLSNPEDYFIEQKWLEGRVLAGYDEEAGPLSNCATVFMRGRENYISNTESGRTQANNYEVESEKSVLSMPVEWRLKEENAPAKASVGVLAISSREPYAVNTELRDRIRGLANLYGFLFSLYALNNQAKLDAELKQYDAGVLPVGVSRNAPPDFVRRVVAMRRKIAHYFESDFIKKGIHTLKDGQLVVTKSLKSA